MRGEGVHCAGIIFLTGLCEKETKAGRDVFTWEKVYETPSPRRSRRPTAKGVTMQATSNSASFRSIKMCSLSTALKSPDVDFFLHKNKVLHSDVVGVLVHLLGETGTMEQLYSSNAFFSLYHIVIHFKPESPVSSAPCSTCGRRGKLVSENKKKCWFMV